MPPLRSVSLDYNQNKNTKLQRQVKNAPVGMTYGGAWWSFRDLLQVNRIANLNIT